MMLQLGMSDSVSTHSRLKAAGPIFLVILTFLSGFNTQPPKGGWVQP